MRSTAPSTSASTELNSCGPRLLSRVSTRRWKSCIAPWERCEPVTVTARPLRRGPSPVRPCLSKRETRPCRRLGRSLPLLAASWMGAVPLPKGRDSLEGPSVRSTIRLAALIGLTTGALPPLGPGQDADSHRTSAPAPAPSSAAPSAASSPAASSPAAPSPVRPIVLPPLPSLRPVALPPNRPPRSPLPRSPLPRSRLPPNRHPPNRPPRPPPRSAPTRPADTRSASPSTARSKPCSWPTRDRASGRG